MPNCSIYSCKIQSKTSNLKRDGISFHLFPKESVTRDKWIKACRNHVTWVPKRTSTVCSRHFETSCFVLLANNKRRLKQGALPTLQLSEDHISLENGNLMDLTEKNEQQPKSLDDSPRNKILKKRLQLKIKQIKKLQSQIRHLKKKVAGLKEIINTTLTYKNVL